MCAVCGFTNDDFWASFAIDSNGTLSPPTVRAKRAQLISRWINSAIEQNNKNQQLTIQTATINTSNLGSSLFSSARIKASVRGYTFNSPTGAMSFFNCLLSLMQHIKKQHPKLSNTIFFEWPDDYQSVDWAIYGAAWTWNSVMNDVPIPLPTKITLLDGRELLFEPLAEDKIRVSLADEVVA